MRLDTENDSNNVMKNNHLDSEFEPVGSQQHQYNGNFVPYLPPMEEKNTYQENQNNDHAQQRAQFRLDTGINQLPQNLYNTKPESEPNKNENDEEIKFEENENLI